MIELELPHEVNDRIKLLLADSRGKGKKLSVAKYIEALVVTHLKQKGLL
jgi:hypothetical protein